MDQSLFYKNSELADELGISAMSISRYIDQAKQGKLNLELLVHNKDYKIKKTELNKLILHNLTSDKSKFKNPTKYKTIQIPTIFDDKYNLNFHLELIRDLKNSKLINQKFAYLGENHLNYYLYQQSRKKNVLRSSLLANNLEFFLSYAKEHNVTYNIIELGPMDLISSNPFIDKLHSVSLVESYTAIDISTELLSINELKFKKLYPTINYNYEQVDIEQTDIYDIILDTKYTSNKTNSINIFMIIGSTVSNLSSPNRVFRNISESLSLGDFLIIDLIKEYPEMEKNKVYEPNNLYYNYISTTLKDLGMSDNDFTILSRFEEKNKIRKVVAVMNENIFLKSKFSMDPIEFKKGSEILLSINRVDIITDLSILNNYKMDLVNLNSSVKLDYLNCVFTKI